MQTKTHGAPGARRQWRGSMPILLALLSLGCAADVHSPRLQYCWARSTPVLERGTEPGEAGHLEAADRELRPDHHAAVQATRTLLPISMAARSQPPEALVYRGRTDPGEPAPADSRDHRPPSVRAPPLA